jgi:hypothetical protein
VFVGACEQNKDQSTEACLVAGLKYKDNVRVMTLPHTQAKGPTYARQLCSTLYRGETYFLQIDSHTKFAQGWDDTLIDMLRRCPSTKPVLTHYPHTWGTDANASTVPVMCKSKWNDNGILTFEAVAKPLQSGAGLKPVPFVAGGFIFCRGSMLREVPFDPNLPYLFQGEELLLSARLWTHGYDFYTPDRNVVFHHYIREDSPKFWKDIGDYKRTQAATLQKVRYLLGTEPGPPVSMNMNDAGLYGLGRARTLQQYWAFAGVDPHGKTSNSEQLFCSF